MAHIRRRASVSSHMYTNFTCALTTISLHDLITTSRLVVGVYIVLAQIYDAAIEDGVR